VGVSRRIHFTAPTTFSRNVLTPRAPTTCSRHVLTSQCCCCLLLLAYLRCTPSRSCPAPGMPLTAADCR